MAEAIRQEEEMMKKYSEKQAANSPEPPVPEGGEVQGQQLPEVKCSDRNPTEECSAWASHGECTRNPGFMRAHCRKSCNLCSEGLAARGSATPADEAALLGGEMDGKCKDVEEMCSAWAKGGECDRNTKFMHSQCRKSCGLCVDESAEQEAKDAKARRHKAALSRTLPQLGANKQPAESPALESPGPAVQCVDANSRCGDWAKAGECSRNPQFMRSNCMKSCDLCNESRFQQPSS